MGAISARELRKTYGRLPRAQAGGPGGRPTRLLPFRRSAETGPIVALDGLDLEVHAGEFFGLLGPNGAGKTTTIGILTTRVRPTSGTASVAGVDVVADPVGVRRRIGVVPQRPNLDRGLTVLENLVFHAAYFGIDRVRAERDARDLLERFGLLARASARVDEMSGGQQQRLMIARALIHEPGILFLDEPTTGLDPQARLELWDVLRELHRQGRTIVITTHYMEEADQLCERVGIVDRGRLLAVDSPAALKARAPGGTLVEVSIEGDAGGLLAGLPELAGVIQLQVDEHAGVVRVRTDRPGEAVAALLRAVEQSSSQVRDIRLVPPSLESLFIAMTGRGLE